MTPPVRMSPSVRSARTRSPASRHVGNGSATPVRQTSEEYFPIWDSETGESKNSPSSRGLGTSPLDKVPPAPSRAVRQNSVDSIPDMDAPPPPVKQGSTPKDVMQGEYKPDQTYDHPKSYHPAQYVNMDTMESPPRGGAGELYQVPPPLPHQRVGVDDGVYKVPPARYTQQGIRGVSNVNSSATDSWYQVPPPAKGTPVRQSHDMFYDVPPSRPTREQTQRNSNSSNESKSSQKGSDSAYGSEDFYDHPPAQRAPDPPVVAQVTRQLRTTEIRSTAASVISQGDVYDVPPPRKAHSDDNILERVPPPPKTPQTPPSIAVTEEQGPYLNIPPNSKAHPGQRPLIPTATAPPKRTTVTMDDMYDFPPSLGNKDRAMLSLSPPPPHACATTQHGYVNAPPGFVANTNTHHHHHTDSVYMAMDLGHVVEPSDHMIIQDDIYLPMGSRDSRTSSGSAIYADMTGTTQSCPAPPPSTRSYSAAPGTQPPRLQKRITPQNSQGIKLKSARCLKYESKLTCGFLSLI